jgi:hypothetical protein
MAESRKADRIRALMSAQVIFNKGASTFDCVVKNISTTGARLEITDSTALPADFDLHIPHKGKTYRATIAWRGDGLVGVEFVGARNDASLAEEAGADAYENLKRENARLKKQVAELKTRVAQLTGEE